MNTIEYIFSISSLIIGGFTFLLAVIFLLICLYLAYKKHFDLFTILSCNTCIGTLIFVVNTLAIISYMIRWNEDEIQFQTDLFCTIRAYINYISFCLIYYSYVLQALYRYWRVKRIIKYNSILFRIIFLVIHWILSSLVPIPILLYGDLTQISYYVCYLSFSNIKMIFYGALTIYISSLSIILYLYYKVIQHVQTTTVVFINQRLTTNRDIIIFRRIIQIILSLIICGAPYLFLFLISLFKSSLIPNWYLYFVFFTVLTSILIQMILLMIYTRTIMKYLLEMKEQIFGINDRNRIQPIRNQTTTI